MKRVVKQPDVRRMEIIHAAEKLFEQNGYTKTSVEAIIKEVGIAKGTFYYYFKSKQEILRALVEVISIEVESYFASILQKKDLTATEKLHLMLSSPEKNAIIRASIMEILHKPENRELQEKLNIQAVEIIAPHIAGVFAQGFKEGDFQHLVSLETIQVILAGMQFVIGSGLFQWPQQKQIALTLSIQSLLEQLAGVEIGAFAFISDGKPS